MRFSIIPFALLVVPVLEIAAFIAIGGQIGIIATLLLIVVTAVIGSFLLRVQGFATLARIRTHMDAGTLPGRELGDGAMILAAGMLLLTPGFVTDTIGFLLFVPALRTRIWNFLSARVVVATHGTNGPFSRPNPGSRNDAGRDPNVVDLDPDDFSEKGNPDSPWGTGPEKIGR